MTRTRKFVFTIISFSILCLLIEGVAYGVLYFFANNPDPLTADSHLLDAHRDHRLNPSFRLSRNEPSDMHTPNGFRRDGPVPVVKAPRSLRIIAMGTSALYGAATQFPYPYHRPLLKDETITAQLEQQLQQQLSKDGIDFGVEVINAGVTAYKTFHHLIYLNADILDYSPDIVINIDGHNDFYREKHTDRWNTYGYATGVLVDEFNGRSFFLPLFTLTRAMAPYSNSFNLLDKIVKRLWNARAGTLKFTPHRPPQSWDDMQTSIRGVAERTYLRDLWQIHNLGQYAGYDHYVFLQPEVVFEADHLLSDHDQKMKEITVGLLPKGQLERMQQVRQMLPDLFTEYGIPFFDVGELSGDNPAQEDLYIDYCHLTPAGAKVAAQNIFRIMYPIVAAKINSLLTSKQLTNQQ